MVRIVSLTIIPFNFGSVSRRWLLSVPLPFPAGPAPPRASLRILLSLLSWVWWLNDTPAPDILLVVCCVEVWAWQAKEDPSLLEAPLVMLEEVCVECGAKDEEWGACGFAGVTGADDGGPDELREDDKVRVDPWPWLWADSGLEWWGLMPLSRPSTIGLLGIIVVCVGLWFFSWKFIKERTHKSYRHSSITDFILRCQFSNFLITNQPDSGIIFKRHTRNGETKLTNIQIVGPKSREYFAGHVRRQDEAIEEKAQQMRVRMRNN